LEQSFVVSLLQSSRSKAIWVEVCGEVGVRDGDMWQNCSQVAPILRVVTVK